MRALDIFLLLKFSLIVSVRLTETMNSDKANLKFKLELIEG